MGALLLAALGLGVAGLDPAGAVLAIAFLARGAASRVVVVFAAVVVVGTAAWGTALSLLLGPQIAGLDVGGLLSTTAAAVVELVLAAGLLAWGVVRLGRPAARPKRPAARDRRLGSAGVAGVGVLFALTAAADPTFGGLVVLAGRDEPLGAVVVAHVVWVCVSQAPLLVVAVAAGFGAHERLVAAFSRLWARVAPAARRVLTAVLLAAGAVLAADALAYLLGGEFLIDV